MNTITQQGNHWLIAGDLWVDNVSELLAKSAALSMPSQLEIDFSAVTDSDTAALSLIMEWQRRALAIGSTVTFKNLPANLSSLATLYGVTEFIPSIAS
jgi:phospholipid transport system transporter-binding protein